jgi:DNA-binding LacI/PurR family transcriptional regulator
VVAVARLAGVSPATVSRVLTGASYVSEATRLKVEDAIDALNYKPNRFAQALITHKSKIIGILLDQSTRYATTNVLVQIETLASQMGYMTVVQTIDAPFTNNVNSIINKFKSVMFEGLIAIAPRSGLSDALYAYVDELPMILITTQKQTIIPSVCEDQYTATRRLMKTLFDGGNRNIWHLAGSQEWFDEQVRLSAWKDFTADHGILDARCIQCTWDGLSAYAAILAENLKDNMPDAIFAASDNLAIAAISALRVRGLRVPDDIAVVGFDDNDFAAYTSPGLTTVVQDLNNVARKSVDLLLERIEGKDVPQQTLLETTVTIRQSHLRTVRLQREQT